MSRLGDAQSAVNGEDSERVLQSKRTSDVDLKPTSYKESPDRSSLGFGIRPVSASRQSINQMRRRVVRPPTR
jgi:hypothetical protein